MQSASYPAGTILPSAIDSGAVIRLSKRRPSLGGARSGIAPDHAHGTLSGFRKLPARLVRGCFLQLDKVTFKQCIQLRACHVQLVWRILYKQ
jgi:hypothetical protein